MTVWTPDTDIVSTRSAAWMQLGTVLEDRFDAATALEKAHLANWNVRKEPVYLANGLVIPEKFATVRDNPYTREVEPLGVVGKTYTPIQNEAHIGFLDALMDESGAHIDAAGQHHGGRDVFISMKLPGHMEIAGVDQIDTYIIGFNNHSGASAFRTVVAPMRPRCTNMQAAIIRGAQRSFTVRHTTNAAQNVHEARLALGLTFKYMDGFQTEAEHLIQQTYTEAQFANLVKELVGTPEDAASKRAATSIQTATEGLMWSFLESPTNEVVRGTKWGAYQAVTEYADWMFPVRGDNKTELRALRTIEGRNDEMKLAAWDALVGASN